MAECIRRSAKEVSGVSRGGSARMEGAWWWSEEAKEKVKAKQEKYKALMGSRTDEEKEANKVQYRMAKREAKKAVVVAKTKAYERLYQRIKSKEGEKEIFKLTRAQERRTRDLSGVRCIKDEDGKVLIEDTQVQERWQSYFYKVFGGRFDVSQHMEQVAREEQHSRRTHGPITREEVKEALRKMKAGSRSRWYSRGNLEDFGWRGP